VSSRESRFWEIYFGLALVCGALATTWVQIIKAILLMAGTILLRSWCWRTSDSASASSSTLSPTYHEKGQEVVKDFLQPGLRFKPPYGAPDLISLGLALIFGTAGCPTSWSASTRCPTPRQHARAWCGP